MIRVITAAEAVAIAFDDAPVPPLSAAPEPIKLIPVRRIGDPRVSSRIMATAMLKTMGALS